jgi:hypothetical protein
MSTGDFPPPGLTGDAYKRLLEATPTEWPPMRPRSDTKELDSLRGTIDSLTKRLNDASAAADKANNSLNRLQSAFDGRAGSLIELPIASITEQDILHKKCKRISIHIDIDQEEIINRHDILEVIRQIQETRMIAMIPPKPAASGTPKKHDQPKGELAGSW